MSLPPGGNIVVLRPAVPPRVLHGGPQLPFGPAHIPGHRRHPRDLQQEEVRRATSTSPASFGNLRHDLYLPSTDRSGSGSAAAATEVDDDDDREDGDEDPALSQDENRLRLQERVYAAIADGNW